MEITTNSTKDTNAMVELQRQVRGRAVIHGHVMGEWAQVEHNLECVCTRCGWKAVINIPRNDAYGLTLTKDCPEVA